MNLVSLRVADLHAGTNPRLDAGDISELAASIAQNGVLDPLRVVKNEDGYRVESGHRRLAAAVHLGLEEVPVLVVEGDDGPEEYIRAIVTNVQRQDLSVVEEGYAYASLEAQGLTVKGIAQNLGVSEARITSRLDLVALPDPIVGLYSEGKLPLSARKSLAELAAADVKFAVGVARFAAKGPEWSELLAKAPGHVAVAYANDRGLVTIPGMLKRESLLDAATEKALAKADGVYNVWNPFVNVKRADDAVRGGFAYRGKGSDYAVVLDQKYVATLAEDLAVEHLAKLETIKLANTNAAADAKAAGTVSPADTDKAERAENKAAELEGRQIARAANLDLGRNLQSASTLDVGPMSVELAQVFVHGLIGPNGAHLFLQGLRYCLPQYGNETNVGTEEKPKWVVDYVSKVEEAEPLVTAWLSPAGAKAGEIVSRAVNLLLAARYADQGCVPESARKGDRLPRPAARDNAMPGLPFFEPLALVGAAAIPEVLADPYRPPSAAPRAKLERRRAAAAKKAAKPAAK